MLISTPSEILETIIGTSIDKPQSILPDKSTKKIHEWLKNDHQFFLLDPLSTIPLRQRTRYVDNHVFKHPKIIKMKVAVAKGDGIGPEIMDATLRILEAAGAQLEYDEIQVGEKVYLSGNTAGIAGRI